jgi:hypothetical protein
MYIKPCIVSDFDIEGQIIESSLIIDITDYFLVINQWIFFCYLDKTTFWIKILKRLN